MQVFKYLISLYIEYIYLILMNKLKFKFSNPRFTFSSRMGKVVDNSSRAIGHPPLILSGPSGVGKVINQLYFKI